MWKFETFGPSFQGKWQRVPSSKSMILVGWNDFDSVIYFSINLWYCLNDGSEILILFLIIFRKKTCRGCEDQRKIPRQNTGKRFLHLLEAGAVYRLFDQSFQLLSFLYHALWWAIDDWNKIWDTNWWENLIDFGITLF